MTKTLNSCWMFSEWTFKNITEILPKSDSRREVWRVSPLPEADHLLKRLPAHDDPINRWSRSSPGEQSLEIKKTYKAQ